MAVSAKSDVRVKGHFARFTAVGPAGSTVTIEGTDTHASPNKAAFVAKWVISGTTFLALIRVHEASGKLHVDALADLTDVATLSTAATAMSLSTISPGHPAPARDPIDTSAIVAAGGS